MNPCSDFPLSTIRVSRLFGVATLLLSLASVARIPEAQAAQQAQEISKCAAEKDPTPEPEMGIHAGYHLYCEGEASKGGIGGGQARVVAYFMIEDSNSELCPESVGNYLKNIKNITESPKLFRHVDGGLWLKDKRTKMNYDAKRHKSKGQKEFVGCSGGKVVSAIINISVNTNTVELSEIASNIVNLYNETGDISINGVLSSLVISEKESAQQKEAAIKIAKEAAISNAYERTATAQDILEKFRARSVFDAYINEIRSAILDYGVTEQSSIPVEVNRTMNGFRKGEVSALDFSGHSISEQAEAVYYINILNAIIGTTSNSSEDAIMKPSTHINKLEIIDRVNIAYGYCTRVSSRLHGVQSQESMLNSINHACDLLNLISERILIPKAEHDEEKGERIKNAVIAIKSNNTHPMSPHKPDATPYRQSQLNINDKRVFGDIYRLSTILSSLAIDYYIGGAALGNNPEDDAKHDAKHDANLDISLRLAEASSFFADFSQVRLSLADARSRSLVGLIELTQAHRLGCPAKDSTASQEQKQKFLAAIDHMRQARDIYGRRADRGRAHIRSLLSLGAAHAAFSRGCFKLASTDEAERYYIQAFKMMQHPTDISVLSGMPAPWIFPYLDMIAKENKTISGDDARKMMWATQFIEVRSTAQIIRDLTISEDTKEKQQTNGCNDNIDTLDLNCLVKEYMKTISCIDTSRTNYYNYSLRSDKLHEMRIEEEKIEKYSDKISIILGKISEKTHYMVGGWLSGKTNPIDGGSFPEKWPSLDMYKREALLLHVSNEGVHAVSNETDTSYMFIVLNSSKGNNNISAFRISEKLKATPVRNDESTNEPSINNLSDELRRNFVTMFCGGGIGTESNNNMAINLLRNNIDYINVVAVGEFAGFPFGRLAHNTNDWCNKDASPKTDRWLAQDFAWIYHPTVAAFAQTLKDDLKDDPEKGARVATPASLMGGYTPGRPQGTQREKVVSLKSWVTQEQKNMRANNSPPLWNVAKLTRNGESTDLIDENFKFDDVANFLKQRLTNNGSGDVVIMTHGEPKDNSVGLLLVNSKGEDSIFGRSDIIREVALNNKQPAQHDSYLVIIAACKVVSAQANESSAIYTGLPLAFRMAGFSRILATFYNVDRYIAQEYMIKGFLTEMRKGIHGDKPRRLIEADAIRKVQEGMISLDKEILVESSNGKSKIKPSDPQNWSPFALIN